MSDSAGIKRPERIRNKSSDDTVLGICWREERELRKAMYVSLRQSQPDPQTSTLNRSTKQPVGHHCKLNWRHKRSRTDGAKPQSVRHDQPHQKGFNPKGGLRRSKAVKRSTRSSSYSARRRGQPNHASSQQALGEIIPNRLRSSVRNSSSVGGSAQSVSTSTSKQGSKCLSSRSLEEENDQVDQTGDQPSKLSHTECANSMVAKQKFKKYGSRADRNRPLLKSIKKAIRVSNASSASSSGQQRLPPTSPPAEIHNNASNHLPENLPLELWQDPQGQPVSVHDFVEYICYHGSPCLDSKLKWFSNPRPLGPLVTHELTHSSQQSPVKTSTDESVKSSPSAIFRHQSVGQACNGPPLEHFTNFMVDHHPVKSDRPNSFLTKSALGCVAKKMAAVNPTTRLPIGRSIRQPDSGKTIGKQSSPSSTPNKSTRSLTGR